MDDAPVVKPDDKPQTPVAEMTDDQRRAINRCRWWWMWDKSAKQPYVDEMDENDKMYQGKHWDLIGPHGGPLRTTDQQQTRPNCVENAVFALVESLAAEFANEIDLVFMPVEATDDAVAAIMTDLIRFIAYKNRLGVERLRWLRNFFKHGTAIWEHVWDPHWRGGRGPNRWEGDVRWRSLAPRHFFPDARCGEDLSAARRVHKAKYVTLEYLREQYPTYGSQAIEEVMDSRMLTFDEEEIMERQMDMVLLVETWYMGEPMLLGEGEENHGPGLHVIWWAGEGQPTYLHHANYAFHDPGEEPAYPFTLRQRYPRDGTIWGHGEPWYLKQPQIAMNKTAELILEGHMHQAVGMTLYQAGALSEQQKKHVQEYGTLPGVWHEVQDIQGVRREFSQGMPASLQAEVNRLQHAMENITGRFDVSQGRTPGSVTAFRALDLLAQRAQVRLRAADVAIQTAYEDAGHYINHLVCRNYTESRAFRIIGQDNQNRPAVERRGVFNAAEIQRVYDYNTGAVTPANEYTAQPGAVPGVDFEIYSPELDVTARTTTQMPSDRTFYMEMAKELFTEHLIDAETFFHVLDRGIFPPVEELLQKMQQQQQAAAMGMPGGPGGPDATGGAGLPGAGGAPATLGAMQPGAAAAIGKLPPDMQKQALQASGPAARLTNSMGGGG